MSMRPTVRRLVGEDLASEQMLALMREAAGLPVVELRRIIAEELALMEVVGTGLQGAPTSVAAYVSRPDGVVRALDFDIGPAPSDPRWPGRRRYRCVRQPLPRTARAENCDS